MAKEYLKIWFSDIETAHEFFEGNDKHLGEFLVNVYRSYAELPTSFRCKQVEKYFKTYSKQIEFIKVSKANGLKAHLQDIDSEIISTQTPEGVAKGVVQGGHRLPLPPPQEATLQAKDKEEKINYNKENSKEKNEFSIPTFDDFYSFCLEKGFDHIAKKAFDYYSANDWKDNQNRQVKNWKLKLQSVWFDETKNPKPKSDASNRPKCKKGYDIPQLDENGKLIFNPNHNYERPYVDSFDEDTYYKRCIERFHEPFDYETEKPFDLKKLYSEKDEPNLHDIS